MANLTPIAPGVPFSTVTPFTPSASDQILAGPYGIIILAIVSSTGTPTVTVTDQLSAAPAGLTFTGQTVSSGALTVGQTRLMRLDASRFKDVNGNIQIATASFAGTTMYAIGL